MRLRTDGASRGNPGPAAIGVVIEDDQGIRLRTFHRFIGNATNNEAEYHALIDGLKAVAECKPDRLEVYLDSKLIVDQVSGKARVKTPHLEPLHRQAIELLKQFGDVAVGHVERESNRGADKLANMALDAQVKKATPHG